MTAARAIDRVWAKCEERVGFWMASWRAAWPIGGVQRTLEPDPERLEFVIADLSDSSVDAALKHVLATVAPGGNRPAAAFLAECMRRRSDNWRRAARSAWLLDLLCPDCEAMAMQLVIASRPRIECLECGMTRRVTRVAL